MFVAERLELRSRERKKAFAKEKLLHTNGKESIPHVAALRLRYQTVRICPTKYSPPACARKLLGVFSRRRAFLSLLRASRFGGAINLSSYLFEQCDRFYIGVHNAAENPCAECWKVMMRFARAHS
jgi:hypothetical protein